MKLPRVGAIPPRQPAQIGETLPAPVQGAAGNTEGKTESVTLVTYGPRNDLGFEIPRWESDLQILASITRRP
jgi:hypothetical protein